MNSSEIVGVDVYIIHSEIGLWWNKLKCLVNAIVVLRRE